MNRWKVHGVVVAALCVIGSLALARNSSSGTTAPQAASGGLRVGTFDSRSLVVAYYRSPQHAELMKKLHQEHAQAKADGNEQRVNELEKQGASIQELAHKQLMGEAPVDSILQALKPALPNIAKNAGVQLILRSSDSIAYRSDEVEQTDVTDSVLAELHADAKTREVIDQLNAKDRK